MEARLEEIKKRINELLKENGLKVNSAAKKLNIPQKTLNNQLNDEYPVSLTTLLAIIDFFPQISLEWLLKGKGSSDSSLFFVHEEEGEYKRKNDSEVQIINIPQCSFGILPVLNFSTTTDQITADNIIEFMPFAYAKRGDIAILMNGDSMVPDYSPGCYLHMRKINDWNKFLEFGRTYLIELKDSRYIFRKVHTSNNPGKFRLIAMNEKYEEQEIPLKMISRIYMIIAKYEKLAL